jgi:hypothetical protein
MAKGDKPAWRAWIFPLATVALWCSPAVGINVAYGLQSGRSPALIGVSVAAVFFTAVCALRLEMQGSMGVRALASALVAIGIAYNLSNAIGLSAGHRSHDRSQAITAQERQASLRDDAGTIKGAITALDKELGPSSLSSLKAEIAELERSPIFDRAKRCTDATLPDSRAHCEAWEKAKALLAAAEKRDRLAAELASLNEQLRAVPVIETTDPQATTIAHAFKLAGISLSAADIGDVLNWLLAIVAELMAAFGALMCGARFPVHTAASAPASRPKLESPAKPVLQAPTAQSEPLATFLADLVESGTPTAFKALYGQYERLCETAGVKPESPRKIGLKLSKKFSKAKGGDARYFCRNRHGLTAVAS